MIVSYKTHGGKAERTRSEGKEDSRMQSKSPSGKEIADKEKFLLNLLGDDPFKDEATGATIHEIIAQL